MSGSPWRPEVPTTVGGKLTAVTTMFLGTIIMAVPGLMDEGQFGQPRPVVYGRHVLNTWGMVDALALHTHTQTHSCHFMKTPYWLMNFRGKQRSLSREKSTGNFVQNKAVRFEDTNRKRIAQVSFSLNHQQVSPMNGGYDAQVHPSQFRMSFSISIFQGNFKLWDHWASPLYNADDRFRNHAMKWVLDFAGWKVSSKRIGGCWWERSVSFSVQLTNTLKTF